MSEHPLLSSHIRRVFLVVIEEIEQSVDNWVINYGLNIDKFPYKIKNNIFRQNNLGLYKNLLNRLIPLYISFSKIKSERE